jgi:exodeoxyribonuclease V gamma subunit
MSLKIYRSPNTEKLASLFGQFYCENKSVFQANYVVVEASSTKDWLKYELAIKTEIGIVANMYFLNTTKLIDKLLSFTEAQSSPKELIKQDQLIWLIYGVFGSTEFHQKFKNITAYFKDNDLKRYTLAEKVAGLFDRYETFQAEIISKWKNASYVPGKVEEKWQCYLWREINKRVGSRLPDRLETLELIISSLEDQATLNKLKANIPYLALFGQVEYNKGLLELLIKLGEHIEIRIFKPDILLAHNSQSKHRLISSLGSFMQSQQQLFADYTIETESIGQDNLPSPSSLLQLLQKDIISGTQTPISLDEADDSIVINNCFSKNREVEVLYNYLVSQFEKDPSLGAKDICVFSPDITEYTAAISAYFDNTKFKIKHTFYDASFNIEESPFAALEAVLNIDENNLSSEEVLALLNYKNLREKFEFSEDLSLVRKAVDVANIRLGKEGDSNIETNTISWKYGLKRLIFGFCLPDDTGLVSIANEDFYPVDEFEGSQMIDLIKLNALFEQIVGFLAETKHSRTLKEWVEFLENCIDDFLKTSDYDFSYFFSLLNSITQELIENENLDFKVFRHYILKTLAGMEFNSKKGFQGVRFSSLQAFTSSPAKIYAFLGMNNSEFPREKTDLSFDLSNARSISDMDKHLFFNCLISTKSKFYISYVGQSVKDNTSIPPSTIVDELIMVIEPLVNDSASLDGFIVKHPLHGFSTRYNNEKNLKHYTSVSKPKSYLTQIADNKGLIDKEVNINDLIRFLTDPFKWYYNKVLSVYYNDDDDSISENEKIALSHLDNWSIKDEVIHDSSITADTLESYRISLVRQGTLPLKNTGSKDLKIAFNEIKNVKFVFEDLTKDMEKKEVDLDLRLGEYVLKGPIDWVYNDDLVFATASKDKAKYRLKAFVQYLALVLNNNSSNTNLKYLHSKSEYEKLISGVSVEDARKIMEEWCGYYELGHLEIFSFSPEIVPPPFDEDNLDGFLEEFKKNLYTNGYPSDYIRKEINTGFFNQNNILRFKANYERIMGIVNNNFKI